MNPTLARSRTWPRLLTTLVVALAAAGPAVLACRIIVPPPWPPHPHPPPMPVPRPELLPMEVRSHRATIDIRQNTADVTVEAVFHNPNGQRIEGAYVFPIAPRAAVNSFAMTVNGKTLEAELLEADKARGIYEDIVRQAKDPALLEYLDQGLLRARVFPIEPNADVKIHLTYEQVVDRDGPARRLSYPLLSAKPDGRTPIKDLVIEASLETRSPLKSVFTPGFETDTQRRSPTTARVTFEARNYMPDKDFTLVFSESDKPVGVDFLATRKGDDGYFLMLISPDSELQAEAIAAKEICLVIDTSGSMMGGKLAQAREALQFCIENLNDADTFNLIAFSTDTRPLFDKPLPATPENRRQAGEFIAGLKPRGGTAIDDALSLALRQPADPQRVSLVVFMTDGLPTIGEVDPGEILKRLDAAERGRRVFTLGVGYDVNTRLLDGVAARTGGYSSYVRPEENLELALASFYERLAHPVMTDLQLDSGEVRFTEVSPRTLPDLFRGGQVAVTGRFTARGRETMKLSGKIGERRETFTFEAALDGDPRNAFIPRLWAIQRVGFLQEELRLRGRNQELIDEIKRLGRQYGILTEYTSFLIVEEGIQRDRVENARQAFRELEANAAAETGQYSVESAERSSRMRGVGGAAADGLMKSAAAPAAATVSEARAFREAYDDSGIRAEEVAELVKTVDDKTFYLRRADGFLYDSEIPAGQTPAADHEVKAWSDEFFRLLRQYPALARYLQAGTRLVVRLDGKIIRITE
ncbi:MAG: Vault protein inter-alpha-trypsin [Lentisphaerae bacterium ADurb.BinA184]|nr:MAG: Vault protein inter-alpha-trypsin [Lentisphaerae bacterium ADurb.BinA184]